MKNKLLTLLGFATKARKLSFGFEASVGAIKSGKSKLIVVAEDISEKSRKEILFFADKGNIKCMFLEGIDIKALSDAVGRKCGILSVNEQNFADACFDTDILGGNANDE